MLDLDFVQADLGCVWLMLRSATVDFLKPDTTPLSWMTLYLMQISGFLKHKINSENTNGFILLNVSPIELEPLGGHFP